MSISVSSKRGLFTVLVSLLIAAAGCSNDPGSDLLGSRGTVQVSANGTGDFFRIQDAIDGSSPGTLIKVSPGMFQERLVLTRKMMIVGSGPSTVVRAPVASSAVLEIRGTSDVVVENMIFSGPQDGIVVRDSSSITISGVDASGNGEDGIDVRDSSGVSISGTFNGNGDRGVRIRDGSSGVTVEASEITENAGNGVRIRESSDSSVRMSNVSGNGDDGIEVRDSTGIEITDNSISDNIGFALRIENVPDIVLQDNALSGNTEGEVRED